MADVGAVVGLAFELGAVASSGGNTGEPARGASTRLGDEVSSLAPGGGCFSQAVARKARARLVRAKERAVETNTMDRVFPQPRRASQFSVRAGQAGLVATGMPGAKGPNSRRTSREAMVRAWNPGRARAC